MVSLPGTPSTPSNEHGPANGLNTSDISLESTGSHAVSSGSKKISGVKSKTGYVIPKHVKRAIDAVEAILSHRDAYPVGQIVDACVEAETWEPAEILYIRTDRENRLFYYVHFLGRPKRDDCWLDQPFVKVLPDVESVRTRVSVPKQSTVQDSSPPQMNVASVWPGFFQLSQLTKQTTPGSSPYGSSSGKNHDPHEYSPKTIPGVEFGCARIKAWYRSPYPNELWSPSDFLRVCDRCLAFGLPSDRSHNCPTALAGSVVYKKDSLEVREVDGSETSGFTERLFLLAKLFLEDKRTSNDETSQVSQVTPFIFYVVFEKDANRRGRFLGYFSKYKIIKRESPILSCIMVLPSEQRKGIGKLLISIAYELAEREGRQGSAERPLSGPGLAAFMSWWTWRLRQVIENCYDGEMLTISQLSDLSGMSGEDVVETLRTCGALKQWGPPGSGDVKLRESGKRTKIKMTMDMMRALESRSPRGRLTPNEFDPKCLSEHARLCPVVATPVKI